MSLFFFSTHLHIQPQPFNCYSASVCYTFSSYGFTSLTALRKRFLYDDPLNTLNNIIEKQAQQKDESTILSYLSSIFLSNRYFFSIALPQKRSPLGLNASSFTELILKSTYRKFNNYFHNNLIKPNILFLDYFVNKLFPKHQNDFLIENTGIFRGFLTLKHLFLHKNTT